MNELIILDQVKTDEGLLEAMKTVSVIANTKISVIKTPEQESMYSAMILQSRGILKSVETKRKEIVDPINRLVKSVNEYIKNNFTRPIEAKDNEVTTAIKVWRVKQAEEARKQQEKAEKLQAKMQAQADKAGLDIQIPTIIPPAPDTVTRTDLGQVHERKNWVIGVTDKMELIKAVAAGQIPDSVLDPNLSNIRSLTKSGMQLPGVKAGYEMGIATRSV